jgi:hypothetical protein
MARKKPVIDDYSFTITKIKENPDGSAECTIDISDFVKGKLIEKGVIALLQEYIDQEKKKNGSAGRN